jgi:hypothetical protein
MPLQKKLIQSSLAEIKNLVKLYERKAYNHKRVDAITDYAVGLLGYLTTGLLVVQPDDPRYVQASTATAAIAAFITSVKVSLDSKKKYGEAVSIASHLRNLYRDTLVVLAKNHLTKEDYARILTNLTHEINITNDADPIIDPSIEHSLNGHSFLNLDKNNTASSLTPGVSTAFHVKYENPQTAIDIDDVAD